MVVWVVWGFAFLMVIITVTALSIVASVINRHQPKSPQNNPQGVDPDVYNETLNDLNKCESDLKHWKGEAAREQNFRKEQVEIRDKRIGEYGGTIANLEQQLRIAQDKLEGFSTPRGRLKIKSGLYHALGKSGLDVTETLDQIILDDQLVLNVRYNDLFFPDPWPGVRKHLTIEFYHGPREFSVIVPENTKLTLPFPYSDLV